LTTFSWSTEEWATFYRLQVAASDDFSSPQIDTTASSGSYTPREPLAPGHYYWRVLAANRCAESAWAPAWQFDRELAPGTPDLSAPADGSLACDTTPPFSWLPVTGTLSYQIQVAAGAEFLSPIVDETTTSTLFTVASALPPGKHYWRVRAWKDCGPGHWSVTRELSIMTAPATPTRSAPPAGGDACSATADFSWSSADWASSYRLQVDDSASFITPEIDTMVQATSYTPESPLAAGAQHWRLQAVNACGASDWSSGWAFMVWPSPVAPVLRSPAGGGRSCGGSLAFVWSPVPDVIAYRIQIARDAGFTPPVDEAETAGTRYDPGASLPPGTYHWRVRAADPVCDGFWSAGRRFEALACGYLPVILRGP
jgi:hypothetical protein